MRSLINSGPQCDLEVEIWGSWWAYFSTHMGLMGQPNPTWVGSIGMRSQPKFVIEKSIQA